MPAMKERFLEGSLRLFPDRLYLLSRGGASRATLLLLSLFNGLKSFYEFHNGPC